jgi:SWI/SNF-related matrix-associated actin-dependent regulator 1 of chromatin subfamily A
MGLPRAAGFQWDRSVTRWHHGDALAALKLRDYADEGTQAKLDAAAEVARVAADIKAHSAAESVMASRATDAAIALPIAEGRAFLPYQRAGIAFALARPNVLIGDDMGLGKTLETIGVINADQELRKILIVCPASLSRNWVREFGMFGSRPLTIGIATMKAVPATDIVVCTYDVFSRSTEASKLILATTWDCLVLDEAHYCKNRDAKRTHVILGGGRRGTGDYRPGIQVTKRRLYLTGTPIGNRPIELWPLSHSLAPAEFGNMMDYAKRYCDATCGRFGWDFSGSSNLDELQDKLRGLFMLRRLKKDVLAELPAKRRQIIELPADTPALRAVLKLEMETGKRNESDMKRLRAAVTAASDDPAAYEAAVAALRKGEQIAFSEISKVRHQTAIAKAPVVAAHVREAVEAGGKIIVFAHHQDVVDHLCAALADLGVVSVTGGTPPAKRQEAVDRFQTDDAVRVFVGNIQAAGVGITLTASAHVIFAELDWVPGNVSQAEDRAHRLGQLCSVLVQHLVLEGSIDCKMAATLTEKQKVLDAALDTVESDGARDHRLAAMQADMDAEIAAAQADAKAGEAAAEDEAVRRADQKARRAEVDAALNAIRTANALARASRARAKRAASVARKAAKLGSSCPAIGRGKPCDPRMLEAVEGRR